MKSAAVLRISFDLIRSGKMDYNQALSYIHSIPKFRRPLGNEKLEKLLKTLGNPHEDLKCIHIAGTNGKGSCAAMLNSVLSAAGFKTGMYTSPFIEVFNERIRINDTLIDDSDLVRITKKVKTVMEENSAEVSEFAFITAMAFVYFKEQNCDFVVLETGMGGKLDATNVIKNPILSVLMSISLDHTQFLGETIEEIALEKCGIIKENGCVVSYPNENIRELIKSCAKEKNAEIVFADGVKITEEGFEYCGKEYRLSLKGAYQPYNAAVAVEAVNTLRKKGVNIPEEALVYGLLNTSWPARFEFVRENVVIDGGHNEDGIRALKKSLQMLGKDVIAVMAMMAGKNYAVCVKDIGGAFKKVIATEVKMERSLSACELAETFAEAGVECEAVSDIKTAVETALTRAGKNDVVCVCGSLYLAGEVRKMFKL